MSEPGVGLVRDEVSRERAETSGKKWKDGHNEWHAGSTMRTQDAGGRTEDAGYENKGRRRTVCCGQTPVCKRSRARLGVRHVSAALNETADGIRQAVWKKSGALALRFTRRVREGWPTLRFSKTRDYRGRKGAQMTKSVDCKRQKKSIERASAICGYWDALRDGSPLCQRQNWWIADDMKCRMGECDVALVSSCGGVREHVERATNFIKCDRR